MMEENVYYRLRIFYVVWKNQEPSAESDDHQIRAKGGWQ